MIICPNYSKVGRIGDIFPAANDLNDNAKDCFGCSVHADLLHNPEKSAHGLPDEQPPDYVQVEQNRDKDMSASFI